MAGLQCHSIKYINCNYSINAVKKMIRVFKQLHQDLGLCSYSFARYSKSVSPKCLELCIEMPENKNCLVSKTFSNNSSFNLLESLVGPPF